VHGASATTCDDTLPRDLEADDPEPARAAAQERDLHQQRQRDVGARDAPQARHAAGPERLFEAEAVDALARSDLHV
jgi:hypothetical protein